MQRGSSTMRDAPTAGPSTTKTAHTHSQLWKWTLTADGVAQCRIEDIFAMQECDGTKAGVDPDFYWLGRVPCRTALFFGMVVGVQTYEQRTVYSVDDGSGMIECNLRHVVQQSMIARRSSPSKSKLSSSKYQVGTGTTSPRKPGSSSKAASEATPPIAAVGDIVRVVGRVLNRHHSRMINVDKLSVCRRATEEPEHWLTVAELHQTWYNPSEPSPFVIPKPKVRPSVPVATFPNQSAQAPPSVAPIAPDPGSPSKSSVASSAPSTPSSVSSSHSRHPQSPPRLRHPSRLHTRDLTANTFRIYVKHYMDNAPAEPPRRSRNPSDALDSGSEDDDEIEVMLRRGSGAPAIQARTSQTCDSTPRPIRTHNVDSTPRAPTAARRSDEHGDPAANMGGFSLSHLRRVPELALLARRVVEAETKRRAKEERRKQKEQEYKSQGKLPATYKSSSSFKPSAAMSAISKLGEPKAAKMKRLFRFAIRQLFEEGSIIMWDGPARAMPLQPIPAPSFVSAPVPQHTAKKSNMWKLSSSTAANTTASSAVSSVSQAVGNAEDDDAELSDPPEDEDSYIPLTSAYLAPVVEKAITTILSRPLPTTRQKLKGPPPGPTPEEIVAHLRRRDERWARVGVWSVKDALEWSSKKGRVWCVGDNRWEVCG